MLALSMLSQDPNRQSPDACATSLPARPRETSPQTSELRKQVAMLSVMPPNRPSPAKRPKLSLQTSMTPSPVAQRPAASLNLPASATHSPTIRNTHANKFEPPAPTPSSAVQPQVNFPTTSYTASSGQSPFPQDAPYTLPIGTHSILRNSPLPKRHLSATSARAPRRMFPPVKRVAFQEKLVDLVPTPDVEDSSDVETEVPSTEDEHQRRRETIEAEDGHVVQGRRKRRREWVWRPMDDDVLVTHDTHLSMDGVDTPLSAKSPALSVIEKDHFGTGGPRIVAKEAEIRSHQ